jgi:uncharacterized protein YndB with AHSA1/START domain
MMKDMWTAVRGASSWTRGRFEYARDLAAPPEDVWPHVTRPELMSAWSEAPIELFTAGPGGGPDAVGTVRRAIVPVFGLKILLEEVIAESEPPRRCVYRIISGGAIREHQGTMTLTEIPGGTRLRWEVSFATRWPWPAPLFAAVVGPSVDRSLAALERILGRA